MFLPPPPPPETYPFSVAKLDTNAPLTVIVSTAVLSLSAAVEDDNSRERPKRGRLSSATEAATRNRGSDIVPIPTRHPQQLGRDAGPRTGRRQAKRQPTSPSPPPPPPLPAPIPSCAQIVSPDSGPDYVSRLHKGQAACIDRLQKLADGTTGGGKEGTLDISPVPFFDMEVAGVYPLRWARLKFPPDPTLPLVLSETLTLTLVVGRQSGGLGGPSAARKAGCKPLATGCT